MIKKILELSKVFIKEYFREIEVFNKQSKKKTVFTILLIILACCLTFLSFKATTFFASKGQPELFWEIYFPVLAIIFVFQAILVCTNVFFFSKDLEYVLPLPIKPKELLIAKFNNVISITYGMELIFLAIPLFIYGWVAATSLIYFLTAILVFIIFPIFLITIVSMIMLIVIQLTKFIKNKDVFQILIAIILSLIMSFFVVNVCKSVFNEDVIVEQGNIAINNEDVNNKLEELNNYFVIINPCISLLTNFEIVNVISQLIKLIFICASTFYIYVCLGNQLYLKNILKNIAYINKKKNTQKTIKNKYTKKAIKKAYITSEFKKLIKNPTYFIQCIFQDIFIIIIFLVILDLFFPIIIKSFEEQNLIEQMSKDSFKLQAMSLILGMIQIIFTLNNLSITAVSREGKNAIAMKYMPISLYKQFLWKNIPQVLINVITIIGIAIVTCKNVPQIPLWFYIIGFLIAMSLNVINSFIMLIVDFKKPNLDWVNETSFLKDNTNKVYQMVTTIILIMLLIYLTRILERLNIILSLSLILIIYILIIFVLTKYIKKHITKLYEKIY